MRRACAEGHSSLRAPACGIVICSIPPTWRFIHFGGMAHNECISCGAEEFGFSAFIGTDWRHSGSGTCGFCGGSGFAAKDLNEKESGCARTLLRSCRVLLLSTDAFLFVSRRSRRSSFHGVDSKLETEGHRSEVRADTAYTLISWLKCACVELEGSRHTGSWLNAMLPASLTSLLQGKERCRQTARRCHMRFIV
jgi:hypothetical protein